MTPLSEKDKAEIQRKVRAKKVLKLCIVMMISDRVAHDLELVKIYEFLFEDSYFKDIDIDGEGLQELIREIQRERVTMGLEKLVQKYSKIHDVSTRERAKIYMSKIIPADGYAHEKELEALKILEDIWNK
tara:strand:+ start:53 stop:442 length:390 start_codon:yes stop_codon:yes gene_type:complete